MLRAAGAELHLVRLAIRRQCSGTAAPPSHRVQDCLDPGAPLELRRTGRMGRGARMDARARRGRARRRLGRGTEVGCVRRRGLAGTAAKPAAGRDRDAPRAAAGCDRGARRSGRPESGRRRRRRRRLDTLADLMRPPATLLVTDGAAGGLMRQLRPDGSSRTMAIPGDPRRADRGSDRGRGRVPCGAGGGPLGHPLAGSGRHGADLRLAAAVASLTVEAPGLLGVPALHAVVARLRASIRGAHADAASSDVCEPG